MNVTLNIEINLQHHDTATYEFVEKIKEDLAPHLVEARVVMKCGKATDYNYQSPLKKTIMVKLNVPIERDGCLRRKSPTCIAGKYLDKWISKIQYRRLSCPESYNDSSEIINLNQRTIDMSVMTPEAFAEKHKGNLCPYLGVVVPNVVGMGQQF